MRLGPLLSSVGLPQVVLAEKCGVSKRTVNSLLCHGYQPKNHPEILARKLAAIAAEAGVDSEAFAAAYAETTGTTPDLTRHDTPTEDVMIYQKTRLTPEARRIFGIFRDPFDEPGKPEHIYLSDELRYVRAAMWDAAANGNFLAVVGESGAGKSLLCAEMEDRLRSDAPEVIVIRPYVLTMSTQDNGAGKPLRSSHIIEAIIASVEPAAKTNGSPEAMARRVHDVLKRSAAAKNRHVLVIEEAHDLHTQTLKALKRFWELKDGMTRLLSIILIGQTELCERLNTTSADVREVVQRCDVVRMPALSEVGAYLRFRFQSVDLDADALFTQRAMDEIAQRLIVTRDTRSKGVNIAYPLAVQNIAAACLNFAAKNGARQVDEDVVRTVKL